MLFKDEVLTISLVQNKNTQKQIKLIINTHGVHWSTYYFVSKKQHTYVGPIHFNKKE